VGRGELSGGDLGGRLVSLEGLVGGGLALVAHGELGEVAVVVTLPVVEEQRSVLFAAPELGIVDTTHILW
jgi:hypothetical protein